MNYKKMTKQELIELAQKEGLNVDIYKYSKKDLINFLIESEYDKNINKEDFKTRTFLNNFKQINNSLKRITTCVSIISGIQLLLIIFIIIF